MGYCMQRPRDVYCEFLPNKRISLLIGYYAYVEQLLLSIRMIFKDYKIIWEEKRDFF